MAPSMLLSKPQRDPVEERRSRSRTKEAKRQNAINGGYESLMRKIPFIPEDHRRSLPKIKTLRLAIKYITHLSQLLDGEYYVNDGTSCFQSRPIAHEDFKNVVDVEIKTKNNYRERAQNDEMDSETVRRIQARCEEKKRQKINDNLAAVIRQQNIDLSQMSSSNYFSHSPLHPQLLSPCYIQSQNINPAQTSTFYLCEYPKSC